MLHTFAHTFGELAFELQESPPAEEEPEPEPEKEEEEEEEEPGTTTTTTTTEDLMARIERMAKESAGWLQGLQRSMAFGLRDPFPE